MTPRNDRPSALGSAKALARGMHTDRRFVRAHHLFFVVLLALGHTNAVRADEDPRTVARGHYERGLERLESGSYEAALAEFQQAYAIHRHFAVLYNVGLCELALGRPIQAFEALSKYLKDGRDQVPAERRQQVEQQLAAIRARFAEIFVTADSPRTRIVVDGREFGETPLVEPIRLPAGVHEISAIADGDRTSSRRVEVREGERRSIDFKFEMPLGMPRLPVPGEPRPPALLGLDAPKPRADSRTDSTADAKASGPYRTLGYVLAGAGVAAGVGGFAHYFWNRGRYDDWQAEHASLENGPPSPSYHDQAVANNELADSIEGAETVTWSLFIASGALLAGGVTLIVVDPGSGAKVAWRGTW